MKKFYTLLMLAILSIGCNLGFSRGVNVHATTCAEEEDTTVYTVADVQPEFQGNLFQYLGANIQYPRKAYEKAIAGNVVLPWKKLTHKRSRRWVHTLNNGRSI
jgi:hypothetical protein